MWCLGATSVHLQSSSTTLVPPTRRLVRNSEQVLVFPPRNSLHNKGSLLVLSSQEAPSRPLLANRLLIPSALPLSHDVSSPQELSQSKPCQQLPQRSPGRESRLRGPITACQVSLKDGSPEPEAGAPGSGAAGEGGSQSPQQVSQNTVSSELDLTEVALSLGIFLFWGGWLTYAFTLAPNQTPTIDMYYLQKLVGLKGDDGFVLNSVIFSLWNFMALLPAVYTMLLIPASRTKQNIVPAWPFVMGSYLLGGIALLPYFALWRPGEPALPTEAETQGIASRIFESKITAAGLLLGCVGLLSNAATAPPLDWLEFGQVIQQSKLFHMTVSDFFVLALSAPFWMYHDMAYRDWKPRSSWGLALLAVPLLGPFIYVVLRPGLPHLSEMGSSSADV